jgi:hypothetical protein
MHCFLSVMTMQCPDMTTYSCSQQSVELVWKHVKVLLPQMPEFVTLAVKYIIQQHVFTVEIFIAKKP